MREVLWSMLRQLFGCDLSAEDVEAIDKGTEGNKLAAVRALIRGKVSNIEVALELMAIVDDYVRRVTVAMAEAKPRRRGRPRSGVAKDVAPKKSKEQLDEVLVARYLEAMRAVLAEYNDGVDEEIDPATFSMSCHSLGLFLLR